MTIKQLTLLAIATTAITQVTSMDRNYSNKKGPKPCPQNVRGYQGSQLTPFVNNGVMLNTGTFSHHGPFINTRSGVVVNSGTWNSGNIPHPPYQYYPQHPYAQRPIHPTDVYGRQAHIPTPAQNPRPLNILRYQAQNCELTPQQKSDVEYIQKFKPVCDLLPSKLQGSVSRIDKLNPGEQALFASDIASRLQKDETAQDLKRVLHILVEDKKEDRPLAIVKPTNTENKSLFFGEPKTYLTTIESSWKPFELSPDTKAIGDQLEEKLSNWEKSPKFPAIEYNK